MMGIHYVILLVLLLQTAATSGLSCYECVEVTVLESDGDGSIASLMQDAFISIMFGSDDPGRCSSDPQLNECPGQDPCGSFQAIISGTVGGIKGKVDIRIHACLDLAMPGFSHVQPTGCLEVTEAFNLDEWGGWLNASYTEATGSHCACNEDGCNHPSRVSCYQCVDATITESDSPPSSETSLRDIVVNVIFPDLDPGSCSSPSLVYCPVDNTCTTFDARVDGIYRGITGKTDIMAKHCLDVTVQGFTDVPPVGCEDVNDVYDFELFASWMNVTFQGAAGDSCSCGEAACNRPSGLKCYQCVDATILETDRPPSSEASLRDTLANLMFPDLDPGSCSSPSLMYCPPDNTCNMYQAIVNGKYKGMVGIADVMISSCLDVTMEGFTQAPPVGCTHAAEAYDPEEWGQLTNVTFHKVAGQACGCDEDRCNKQVPALACYTCMDFHITETDRLPNSTVPSVYSKVVDIMYGGVDPGSCLNPGIRKCNAGEVCYNGLGVAEGTLADSGITGKIRGVISSCIDRSQPGLGRIPESGCADFSEMFDKEQWEELLDSTFTRFSGIGCACQVSACNDPRDVVPTLCSSCKEMHVDFGDAALSLDVETTLLQELFEPNTPWCPYAGDIECGAGASCVTLNANIHAIYGDKAGRVELTHHDCMSPEVFLGEPCHDVTMEILIDLYGDGITAPFSEVDKVGGTLCLCQKNLCNLPSRVEPTKKTSSVSARHELSLATLLLMTIACLLLL